MKINAKDVQVEVARWKRLLGLKDWKIVLDFQVGADENYGQVSPNPEYQKAYLSINLEKVQNRKDLRSTVIHELLHVVLSIYTLTAADLAGPKGKKVLERLEEVVVTQIEKWPLWKEF